MGSNMWVLHELRAADINPSWGTWIFNCSSACSSWLLLQNKPALASRKRRFFFLGMSLLGIIVKAGKESSSFIYSYIDIQVTGLKPGSFLLMQCAGLWGLQWEELGEEFLNTDIKLCLSESAELMPLCGGCSTHWDLHFVSKTTINYPLAGMEGVVQLIFFWTVHYSGIWVAFSESVPMIPAWNTSLQSVFKVYFVGF